MARARTRTRTRTRQSRQIGSLLCLAAALLAGHATAEAADGSGFGSLSITGQRGRGGQLALEKLSVRTTVEGVTARTELTHVFRSQIARDTEGVFRLQLPAGATVVRLAMDVNGKLMEGELVESNRARQLYDEIVRARVDPALLEYKGDNRYELSIFPIPARGTKTVVLTYEELVDDRYVLTLPRLSANDRAVGRFEFTLTVNGKLARTMSKRHFRPRASIRVALPRTAAAARLQVTPRGQFALAELRPTVTPSGSARPLSTVFALDTSLSMSTGFAQTRARVSSLISLASGASGRVALVHGDLRARPCDGSRSLQRCLASLDTGGASDLGALLEAALAEAARLGGPARVVLVSDGVPSLGPRSSQELSALFRKQSGMLPVELHAIGVGKQPDIDFLTALAAASGGRAHSQASHRALWTSITQALITDLRVDASGIDAPVLVGPRNIAVGQQVRLLGRLRAKAGQLRLHGRYRGKPLTITVEIDSASTQRGSMVERFWVRQQLGELAARKAPRKEVVALSLKYGVMSPYTSFLVLETAADYRRRGIARTTSARNAREFGAIEGQRVGRGRHAPPKARVARPPQVRIAHAMATGDLDKNILRRVMRSHHKRLRHCYQRALRRHPRLAGRVVVRFSILSNGEVAGAGIEASQVGHDQMEGCIVATIAKMRFPTARGGGLIRVRYPLYFASELPSSATVRQTVAAAKRSQPAEDALEIQILENLGARTTLPDQRRLLALYVGSQQTAKADAFYRRLAKERDPDGTHADRLLAILGSHGVRRRYAADFRRAALRRLEIPHAPRDLRAQVFASYLADLPNSIPAVFGRVKVRDGEAQHMLTLLIEGGHQSGAAALFSAWKTQGIYDDDRLHHILTYQEPALDALTPQLFATSRRLVGSARSDTNAMDSLISSARKLNKLRVAASQVVRVCKSRVQGDEHLQDSRCHRWLRATIYQPAVRRLLKRRIKTHERRRARRPADADLLSAHAATLHLLGHTNRALRLLSEIVEHAPRNPEARREYKYQLTEIY